MGTGKSRRPVQFIQKMKTNTVEVTNFNYIRDKFVETKS